MSEFQSSSLHSRIDNLGKWMNPSLPESHGETTGQIGTYIICCVPDEEKFGFLQTVLPMK